MTSHDRIVNLLDANPAGLDLTEIRQAMPGVPLGTIRAALHKLKNEEVVRIVGKRGTKNIYTSDDGWVPQPWRHPYQRAN